MTDSASKINLFMKISLNYTHSTMLTCVPSAKQTEIQIPMKIIYAKIGAYLPKLMVWMIRSWMYQTERKWKTTTHTYEHHSHFDGKLNLNAYIFEIYWDSIRVKSHFEFALWTVMVSQHFKDASTLNQMLDLYVMRYKTSR